MALLKQNLAKANTTHVPTGSAEQGSLTSMSLDLIILTLPHLSEADASSLFKLCLSSEVLESKDNATQKRGYKILGKLLESGKVQVDAQDVLQQLDKLLDGLSPAAKRVCVRAVHNRQAAESYSIGPVRCTDALAASNSLN